jgi:tetratricopeptide (TPR) repeat protein
MRRSYCAVLMSCLFFAVPSFAASKKPASETMPVTTSSAKARALYEKAMADYENLYLERANEEWRAAVKADPNFALAQVWIAFNSRDPGEANAARAKAKSLISKVTPGERLMIKWITNVQENNFISGIAAMNDMLAMYSKDKRVLYLAGNWLVFENSWEQAEKIFERALAIDKDYPAALNDLGYACAHNREYDKAFAIMDRYVAVLSKEPNPQDSYAELLRMAGHFDKALEHYRASLKIDPNFVSSQAGLGDTYALMGNEPQARSEYEKAIQAAHNDADRLDYSLQEAATWVRENNFSEATKAYLTVAEKAHAQGLNLQEAQAHRMIGMYEPDPATALKHMQAADDVLDHASTLAQSDREEERARILRYRVMRATQSRDQDTADKSLNVLETMANNSRSMVIHSAYHGAAGALLIAREKFADAIPHLEEDLDNPFSLELLCQAYAKTGAHDEEHDTRVKLLATNVTTLEQALIVPATRAKSTGITVEQ